MSKTTLDEILNTLGERHIMVEHRLIHLGMPEQNGKNIETRKAKQALNSLIKELVEEAIGEDESLVEVHKRNLVVASRFNAVVKSRNSLRHKQRQAITNALYSKGEPNGE